MPTIKTRTIGQLLVEARERRDLSRRKAAVEMGVTDQALRLWENDVSEPKPEHVGAIASFLDADYYEIMAAIGYLTEREAEVLQAANIPETFRGSESGAGVPPVSSPPRLSWSRTAVVLPHVARNYAEWPMGHLTDSPHPHPLTVARRIRMGTGDELSTRLRRKTLRRRTSGTHRQGVFQMDTPPRPMV